MLAVTAVLTERVIRTPPFQDLSVQSGQGSGSYELDRGRCGYVDNDAGPDGFNAITNRVSTDTEGEQFLRLQVEFTP